MPASSAGAFARIVWLIGRRTAAALVARAAAPRSPAMSRNLLEQLREMTVVVADTGDIQAIEAFKPHDATTNPSLITAAAQLPQYRGIVDETLRQARRDCGAAAPA